MKPVRRMDSTTQSCSCTSCLYKSESEQLSIRKYIADGSKIDRLYYGKYIPLRERKLLNRLVRTRAVYDDLRARLISDSTLSLEKNADLRPGKHHQVIKTRDSEKSGAILELIDIIDKGAAFDPKKLSDCCSCCSCSSKSKIVQRGKKAHRRKGARTYEEEYGQMGQIGTEEGAYAKTYEREYGKTVPGRMGERYNKRGVRFKAKHIRSDPCTCTFKFSGLIKKHSKAMFRKIRPLPLEEPAFDAEDQYMFEKTKKQNFARQSFQKYKNLQDKLERDLRKLNESSANMKQNLKLRTKKSLERVKQVKNKIKNNIESGVRKSIDGVKALYSKEQTFESIEYPEVENTFKIKKDSIVKFKDYLKRKEMMKDWECDLECEPDICVPEECFKIIKMKRLHKRNRQRQPKYTAEYEMIKREVKVGGAPLKKSSSGVQAEHFATTTATRMKKHKPILRAEGKNQVMEKRLVFEPEEVKKGGVKKGGRKIAEKSDEFSLTHSTPDENALHAVNKKSNIHKKSYSSKEKPLRGRQAVRIKSSFSFDMEFSKNPPGVKTSQLSQPSGIHIKAPMKKRKKVHRHHKKSHIASKSSLQSSQNTRDNLETRFSQTGKYGKVSMKSEQGQLASKVSQCECKEHLSNVKTNTDYGSKSVSSVTNTSDAVTADKMISKEVKGKGHLSQVSLIPAPVDTLTSGIRESYSEHKQAVRIGSTFSFNIEFYKKDDRNLLRSASIKENIKRTHSKIRHVQKVKQSRSKNRHFKQKLVQVKGTSAKAYNQAKTTLRRCFCTLKLHENIKTKKKTKTDASAPFTSDKYVETKRNYRHEEPKVYHLLPYECEPGVCVPGECDPLLCKKILDLRKGKRRISKSVGSYTGSRRTKSTSSIMSSAIMSPKAKIVQSSIVPTKTGKTNAPRRYKNNLNLDRNEILKRNIDVSGRQAVRIGSSFSFNIEFYKDNQKPVMTKAKRPSLSNLPQEIIYKQQKIKDRDNKPRMIQVQDKLSKHSKSMYTEVNNVDKYIGPSLKRCFCTLKLYKNKIPKKKKVEKASKFTANTQTIVEAPIGESLEKGTWTKREHHYKLLSYECEPYTCIPGECDPYICLQNIKRRELNTRNISVFTDKPDTRSITSITGNSFKKSEAVLVQPKLFGKGTNMKANYIKVEDNKSRLAKEIFKASKSKQAVRIGSSFNFSIEFSKQIPGAVTFNKQPKYKQTSKVNPKKERAKGITVTKVRVDHVNTQATGPGKVNKSSLVRPILKRCFCTLNLQKKTKRHHKDLREVSNYFGPNVYTVGRVTTTNTKLISHSFTKLQRIDPKSKLLSVSNSYISVKSLNSKHKTIKLYSAFNILIPNQSRQSVILKSNVSIKIDTITQSSPFKETRQYYIKPPLETCSYACINEKSHKNLKLFNQPLHQNLKKVTSLNRYLKQSFCTMNVQISNQRDTLHMKKPTNKLKPYECEPGICIPGECNPYECKKLIMKRFAKNVQLSSNTNSTNKSISSYPTSYATFDSKSTQMKTESRSHPQVPVPWRYNSQQQHEPNQRRAVRIKSSFSFDLEFYKHQSQPFRNYLNRDLTLISNKSKAHVKRDDTNTPINKDEVHVNRIGTNTPVNKALNRKKYKNVRIADNEKKSDVKKNRIQPIVTSVHTNTTPKSKRCFCTLKLQKKGKIHRENAKLNSLPINTQNVASRNVRIGTNTKFQKIPLDSNDLKFYECEPGICIPGKCDPYKCLELIKHRNDLGVNTSRKEKNSVSSMTSEEYSKGKYKARAVDATFKRQHNKSTKAIEYIKSADNGNPNISSLSYRPAVRIGSNISFNIEFFKDIPQPQQIIKTNLQRVQKSNIQTKPTKDGKELKAIVSPSRKSVAHKVTEIKKPAIQYQNPVITKPITKNNTKTFKHKCFCLLGLRHKENKNDQNAEKSVKTAEKLTNTKYKHTTYVPYLDPKKQQDLVKQFSKQSETESIRTQSASSGFAKQKRPKHEKTQAQTEDHSHQKQLQHSSKSIPLADQTELNTSKNLVRIGSNFSFNIEFYKENINDSKFKEKRTHTYKENINDSELKDKGTHKKTYPDKIDQHGKTNKENILKIIEPKNPEKISIRKQIKKTKSKKLLKGHLFQNNLDGEVISSFECEPFVCVPGECDPVECLKRIKKRQQQTKDSGTVTKYPKKKSIGSVATKKRDEKLQVKHSNTKRTQKIGFIDKSWANKAYNQTRQAVRIGSDFSFNIEFFKDLENNSPEMVAERPIEKLNIQNNPKKVSLPHTKTQLSHAKRDVNSQVISTKLQSTETTVTQFKRCFCTLPFINKKTSEPGNIAMKVQSNQSNHGNSSTGNLLKRCMCTLKFNKVGKQQLKQQERQIQQPVTAVKYEIKGTSTNSRPPQGIVKKPVRTLEPYECEPYVCVPGECDPYECLKRIQRRQVRDFGTDYKHHVKDFATDSIKQPETRSTKVQYSQKRKFNSRGTFLASKQRRNSKETTQFPFQSSYSTNRQVVRIGSNFSFNVQFFKDHVTPNFEFKEGKVFRTEKGQSIKDSQSKRIDKPETKSIGTIKTLKRVSDKKTQSIRSKKQVVNPPANIAPKRCFCTTKLLKKSHHPESKGKSSSIIKTKDKTTATKTKYAVPQELGDYECPPFMCTPGECDPYECLENINRMKSIRKSRKVETTTSLGNQGLNLRALNGQSQVVKRRNIMTSSPQSKPQSEIVKSYRVPENLDRRNKRAVRIGSNFNFNVEFFKQKSQPAVITVPKIVKAAGKKEDTKSYLNKNVTVGAENFQPNSPMENIKLKNQTSNGGNVLKRCFCTLQLQKPIRQKTGQVKIHHPGNNIKYPQTFVVGRVAVKPFISNIIKSSPSKKSDKAKSTFIDSNLLNRTVGTKTNKKYLQNLKNDVLSSQCNPSNCPEYQKRIFKRKPENYMETILPYTPSKFNKKESKTNVSKNTELKKNTVESRRAEGIQKSSETSMLVMGKRRLTAKKSKKSIPTNSLKTKTSINSSFFCRCVKFFSRRSETKNVAPNMLEHMNEINKHLKPSDTKRQPAEIKVLVLPKKAKSFGENCPLISPNYINESGPKHSKLQSGDAKNNTMIPDSISRKYNSSHSKSQRSGKLETKNPQMRVTFADNLEHSKNDMLKRKTNKSIHSKSSTRSRLCYSCSVNDCPHTSTNLKINHQKSGDSVSLGKSIKSNKKSVSYSEAADDCQYCECCKRKIDTDEISKGGGDRRSTITSQFKNGTVPCPCGTKSINGNERRSSVNGNERRESREESKADELSKKHSVKEDKCCSKIKPLLEMRLDSVDHIIINKSEVKKKLDQLNSEKKLIKKKSKQLKTKEDKIYVCCKCLKKQRKMQEVKISVAAKGTSSILGTFGKLFSARKKISSKIQPVTRKSTKPPIKSHRPCICGSKKCAAEYKSSKIKKKSSKVSQRCVCGSKICGTESKKSKRKKEKFAKKTKKKIDSFKNAKERKALLKRIKIQEEKDEKRRKKRLKHNKALEATVKKYKHSSDVMLAVDNLLDVGKLGASSLVDALRYTTKSITDPKVACERLCKMCKKKDRETIIKQLQDQYGESDTAATLRRFKTRCLFMKRVQTLKEKLEENRVTHFVLHMADKNPKTRKFKRKPKRRILEPLDFQCSLYMATLRKRPYLSVYYRWPWFYPHFMTIVNIWKQFTDIMLFLLAAVVWSPCILCMEGCRALMCCFFCTG